MATTVKTWDEYLADAGGRLNPDYESQVKVGETGYNSSLTDLNNRTGGINLSYDKQVADVGRNTTQTQNQYNSNVLGRGMSRSSVATTGLAGIANTGTRLTNEVNQGRTNDLNNVESLKTTLLNNWNAQKSALESKKQGEILSMADQLKKYDEEKAFKEDQAAKDEAYRQAQLAAQIAAQRAAQSAARASNAAALRQAQQNRDIEEQNAQYEQSEKDFNTYLTLGEKRLDKLVDSPEWGGKVAAYSNDDNYEWVGKLNMSSANKYRLASALGLSRPSYLSVNPYYNPGFTTLNKYSGGR